MSELECSQNSSRYDSLTTVELQEILRKHAHDELDTELDTQELYEIMEVLSSRREKAGFPAFCSDEAAFADLSDHYISKTARPKVLGGSNRTFKNIAAVLAIVLVLAVGTTLTVKALNVNVRNWIAVWDDESLRFVDSPEDVITEDHVDLDSLKPKSLQEALIRENITVDIAPTWIPDGYEFNTVNAHMTGQSVKVIASYTNGESLLVIYIHEYFVEDIEQGEIQKDDKYFEIYTVDGIDYYIFSNNSSLQAAWSFDNYLGRIYGEITPEEMKAMIDSI